MKNLLPLQNELKEVHSSSISASPHSGVMEESLKFPSWKLEDGTPEFRARDKTFIKHNYCRTKEII